MLPLKYIFLYTYISKCESLNVFSWIPSVIVSSIASADMMESKGGRAVYCKLLLVKACICNPVVLWRKCNEIISESIELLKCSSGTFSLVACVSKIKSILSIISYTIYVALRIQLTRLSFDNCDNMCTLSYHHEIESMTHLPLFRVSSWNNGMRCMSFDVLLKLNWRVLIFSHIVAALYFVWRIMILLCKVYDIVWYLEFLT